MAEQQLEHRQLLRAQLQPPASTARHPTRAGGYPVLADYVGLLFWESGVAVFGFVERFLVAVVGGWGYAVVRVLVRWDHGCCGEVSSLA